MRFKSSALRWQIPLALVVVLAVTAAGTWLYARHTVNRLTDRWVQQQNDHGVTASLPRSLGLGGFPFAVRQPLDHPVIVGSGWRFTAESAEIIYDLRRTTELAVALTGAGSLTSSDGEQSLTLGAGTRLQFSLEQRALAGGGGLPSEAVLTLQGAAWQSAPGWIWGAGQVRITLRLPEAPPAEHTQPGLTVGMLATGITLPAPLALPSDATNADANLGGEVVVMGAAPALKTAALEKWRADGGTVELRELSGAVGTMVVEGDGTLTLDRALQPIGAGTVKLMGAQALDERLNNAPLGAVMAASKDGKKIRQAIKLLIQPDNAGGPATLTLPLTAQDRRLFVGPFPVAKLPPVVWAKEADSQADGK